MKLVDLPREVLDDLSQEDRWRLDIDPGFDSFAPGGLCSGEAHHGCVHDAGCLGQD